MRKRDIFWLVVLLIGGGFYLHYYLHRNEKTSIQVIASLRPGPRRGNNSVYPVFFTLDGYYKLSSIKVTALESNEFNPEGHVLWSIMAKSNSAEIRLFQYGQAIAGMDPEFKGVKVEPLAPGAHYRLDLTCGLLKGSVPSFSTKIVPK